MPLEDEDKNDQLAAVNLEDQLSEDKMSQEDFTNKEIIDDQQDPKKPSHLDYKYIKSKAGPLYKLGDKPEERTPLVQPTIIKQSFERKKYGGIRMCQRCLRTKPDRCHHCS